METIQPMVQLLTRLWQHIDTRRRRHFFLLLILMIFSSFAEILSIGAVLPFIAALTVPHKVFIHPIVQPFIHLLEIKSAEELLLPLTITFALAAIMAGMLRVLLLWVSIRLTFSVGADLSNAIYRRTLYQPYEVHTSRNSSEVINGITTKIGELIFYILMPSLSFISATVIFLAILCTLLSVIPGIALSALFSFSFIYALIIKLTRNKLKIDSQRIARESNNVIKSLQEGLGGVREVLIQGSQEVFCSRYRNADYILRRAQGSNQFVSQCPRYLVEAFAMILIACLAYILSTHSDSQASAIPLLTLLALGMQKLLPALQQIYGAWSTIHGAQSSLQDALDLLDQPLPNYVLQPSNKPLPFSNQIRLENVSFRYNVKAQWVLKNINLTILKGSRVGFIGKTGSGKSTLIDLIMGLLQPSEGVIKIDEVTTTKDNYPDWRCHIAHVPQTIFLTDSNVEENIAFGIPRDKIDHELVRQSANQAQIAEIIESWPNKYQTNVGERGIQLSGGQRQRIGIARALYKKADILVFDEATSSLDNETEQSVMESIESLNTDITVLIIAHRLSTIKNCSEVFEVGSCGIKQKK
jgi:ABC-type multidrug transport system fused ATPase/permease subunit